MIRLEKTTGALIRFIFQLLIAVFQIIAVAALVYPNMIDMLEVYQLYLTMMPEIAAPYLFYFIGLLALLIMGILHAVWRIVDNLVTWRTAA